MKIYLCKDNGGKSLLWVKGNRFVCQDYDPDGIDIYSENAIEELKTFFDELIEKGEDDFDFDDLFNIYSNNFDKGIAGTFNGTEQELLDEQEEYELLLEY